MEGDKSSSSTSVGFYQSFLDLYKRNDSEPHDIDRTRFREENRELVTKKGKSAEVVAKLAENITRVVCKPQRLLHDDPNYYIAIDMATNTYYICYKNLMMIDIDFYKDLTWTADQHETNSKVNANQVLDKLAWYSFTKDLGFMIYKSKGGLHVFVTSSEQNYKDLESIQLMLDVGCDFYYAVYSHVRGWSVRLNRKIKEDVMKYDYIDTIGENHNEELVSRRSPH